MYYGTHCIITLTKLKLSNDVSHYEDYTQCYVKTNYARFGLVSLSDISVKADLILCCAILHNLVNIDCDNFMRSTLCHSIGNSKKLNKS